MTNPISKKIKEDKMKEKTTIAITGHRDIIETDELRKKVSLFFDNLIKENKEITLLSPLADGADRFVAKIFLTKQKEHKHLNLIVPMPFSKERYLEDFDKASKKEFFELLKRTDNSFKVPSFMNSGYVDLGRYIVNSSNVLLALWDGTFNGKAGGTGDVVNYAQGRAKLVHFVCERENESKK